MCQVTGGLTAPKLPRKIDVLAIDVLRASLDVSHACKWSSSFASKLLRIIIRDLQTKISVIVYRHHSNGSSHNTVAIIVVMKHWHRLHREVVGAPSLEILKVKSWMGL